MVREARPSAMLFELKQFRNENVPGANDWKVAVRDGLVDECAAHAKVTRGFLHAEVRWGIHEDAFRSFTYRSSDWASMSRALFKVAMRMDATRPRSAQDAMVLLETRARRAASDIPMNFVSFMP